MVVWPWLFLWLIGRAFGSQLPDAFKLVAYLLLGASMWLAPPLCLILGCFALKRCEQPRWLTWMAIVFNLVLIVVCFPQLFQSNPSGLDYLQDLHFEEKS
jgi:hypothetical protein